MDENVPLEQVTVFIFAHEVASNSHYNYFVTEAAPLQLHYHEQ